MNSSPTTSAGSTTGGAGGWLLEIVRGRDVGRAFGLELSEVVLGNALNGQQGIDLADQEGNSPRRMAARHATVTCSGQDISIRDLESPGGTFVNQQRLLSGQSRKLEPGDVIQLGGVQLRVKRSGGSKPASAAAIAAGAAGGARGAGAATTGPPAAATGATSPRPVAGAAADTASRGQAAAQRPAGPAVAATAAPAAARSAPAAAAVAQPAAGGRLPAPFVMASGAQCRTWDDFLVLSAQSWNQMRDELASGRLTDYLRKIGRPDLVLHSAPGRSADARLDEWLARVPATQSSAPELDVHPEALLVQANMGGGVKRLSLSVTNVGFRLLRSAVRIEPPDARWVKLLAGQDGETFETIDQTVLPVEVTLPETIDGLLRALIVVESNGGTRRVEVRVERAPDPLVEAGGGSGAAVSEIPVLAKQLARRLAGVGLFTRAAACAGGAIGLRLLVAAATALPFLGSGAAAAEARIGSVALVAVALGVCGGLLVGRRRGEARDVVPGAVAGAALGLLSSAVSFSLLKTVERILGSWSTSILAVCLLWGALGAGVGLLTAVVVPVRRGDRRESP